MDDWMADKFLVVVLEYKSEKAFCHFIISQNEIPSLKSLYQPIPNQIQYAT